MAAVEMWRFSAVLKSSTAAPVVRYRRSASVRWTAARRLSHWATSEIALQRSPTSPPRLLIVEDEAVVALGLAAQLVALGFEVCGTADSAAGAIEMVGCQRPDLVLMDIMLFGRDDGVAAAEEIVVCHGVPVVFVSAYTDDKTIARARQAGALGFVTKPFSVGSLRAAIELALAKHADQQCVEEAAELYRATLGGISAAVLVTDVSCRVLFMNRAAARLLAHPLVDCLGAELGVLAPWLEVDLAALFGRDLDVSPDIEADDEPPSPVGRSVEVSSGEQRYHLDLVLAPVARRDGKRGVVWTIDSA
jgi:DNA-binding response OmpR family regulator